MLFIIIFGTYSFAMTVSVCSVTVKITRCSETPDTSRFSSRTTSSFRCSESNGNRNTVSSVASLQCFDAVGWFLKSVWCMRIESYQVSKQLYQHRLQNKHTDSCNRYSFVVFKTAVCCIIVPILTVLPYDLSLFPRYYREDRPHPVLPLAPSPCSFPYRILQFCFKKSTSSINKNWMGVTEASCKTNKINIAARDCRFESVTCNRTHICAFDLRLWLSMPDELWSRPVHIL